MTKNVRFYLSGFYRKWVVSACVYRFANQQRKLHKNTKNASKNNFYCCKSLISMHIEECPHIRLYIRLHTRKHETPHYRSYRDSLLSSEFLYRLPVKSTDLPWSLECRFNEVRLYSTSKNIFIYLNLSWIVHTKCLPQGKNNWSSTVFVFFEWQ